MSHQFTYRVFGSIAVLVFALNAQAQTDAGNDQEESIFEEVVVTGVARGTVKLDTSISVSSLDYNEAYKFSARGVAEIYRSLPGLRSEPATGEGNGSIAVRGIPLATGGYKYVQVQEDGLPILQYGDIIVGNVPNFVRGDFTLARIESIRGGSASTLTSDAPGGIINHISKTGEEGDGGSIGMSQSEVGKMVGAVTLGGDPDRVRKPRCHRRRGGSGSRPYSVIVPRRC